MNPIIPVIIGSGIFLLAIVAIIIVVLRDKN